MEPSDERVLRVNRTKTALVLGGSVPSAVPPNSLISMSKEFVPLQGDTVKNLASILTPPLCPSALSSKFKVAVMLYGLPGASFCDLLIPIGFHNLFFQELVDIVVDLGYI